MAIMSSRASRAAARSAMAAVMRSRSEAMRANTAGQDRPASTQGSSCRTMRLDRPAAVDDWTAMVKASLSADPAAFYVQMSEVLGTA